MEEIKAIVVCGSCHSVFNSGDMSHPCPKCQGAMVIGMVADTLLNDLEDAQVMHFLNAAQTMDFEMGEILADEGFEYDPNANYPNRLTKIEAAQS